MGLVEAPPPLAVFDCSLFLQAVLRGSGPASACFELVEKGRLRLVVSSAILAEVRDVLTRPKLIRKYPQLASPHVAEFLETVVEWAEYTDPVPEIFPYRRDPKDQPYLDLAVAVGADFLVSRDRDLLDLQAADSEAGQDLRRSAPKLTILNPVELLRRFSPTTDESG
ncbi:MAG: putative toxin-antitoxin system toxin component, PIN family [Armatimonadota bacterium]